jgi:hypothetical protein
MQDPKNEGKTVEELRAIVAKNLAKDLSHYVKDGQFGIKGVGYTTEAPGLGTPKPAKGKHKASGYGDLKESVLRAFISEMIKEALTPADEMAFSKAAMFAEKLYDKTVCLPSSPIITKKNVLFIYKEIEKAYKKYMENKI